MTRMLPICGVVLLVTATTSAEQRFVRGDVNCDGVVDSVDAIDYSDYFVYGIPVPPCLKASDVNGDGIPLTISDLNYLNLLLNGSLSTLPPPFPYCGTDTFDVECDVSCCPSPRFIRGDFNCDGVVDTLDRNDYGNFLATGSPLPPCQKASDVNADGIPLTTADEVFLVRLLTGDIDTLPAPYPECGTDTFSTPCEATCCPPESCVCVYQADPDSTGSIDSADLAVMIDCVFFSCNPVPQEQFCPGAQMDFNCDGFVDSIDLAEIIDHVYFSGPGPCNPCDCYLYPVNCT